ncbi:MAG: glycosyltransferase family 1 protein, partial [bacterium]
WLQRWYLPLSTIYATKAADRLIAVSKFTAKQLEKELHTSSKKIKVIYEGVDLDDRRQKLDSSETLKKYGLLEKRYILFVGSLQPRKNLVTLVEAFSHFASIYVRDTVSDYKLVLAGGVGWMAEEILSAPTRFGVQDKVVFTGRVSEQDLQSLYRGAALYVQPSIMEGFGLPILEAMSAGVPVISSDGGALPEVVGEAGIIVNLKSQMTNSQIEGQCVDRLARAMKRVASDKKLREKLINMGYKKVKEFGWEKAARQTLSILVGEGYNS